MSEWEKVHRVGRICQDESEDSEWWEIVEATGMDSERVVGTFENEADVDLILSLRDVGA